MRTAQLVLAALITAYASPAFAGAAIYHIDNGDDRDERPLPRVIYGVTPPPAPMYPVDQGPSFEAPVMGYAAPRVYTTEPDHYPYIGPRVHVAPPLAADPYIGGDTNGYLVGPTNGPMYGGYGPYGGYGSVRRHDRRHHQVNRAHNGPRVYTVPRRSTPMGAGSGPLTGAGGMPHAHPGSLAGAPTGRR